ACLGWGTRRGISAIGKGKFGAARVRVSKRCRGAKGSNPTFHANSECFAHGLRRMTGGLVKLLRSAIGTRYKRVVFSFYRLGCRRCDISGLTFYLPFRDREAFDKSLEDIRKAVRMLERFDPVRLQRIRRDLNNGIMAVPAAGQGGALYH